MAKKTKTTKLQDKPINWDVVYKFIEANPVESPYPDTPPLNPTRLWYIMQDPQTPKKQVNFLLQKALDQGFDIYAPAPSKKVSSLANPLLTERTIK